MIVAVDGPAGSGKGTITKRIEKELGFLNLDTGATYRCVALAVLRNNVDLNDEKKIIEIANKIEIKIDNSGEKDIIFLDGEDVSKSIREKEVTQIVSQISSIIPVRERLVEVQRELAKGKNVIVEGRDIGTVVFPNADLKIYLDASIEARTQRRYKEMQEAKINMTYDEVLNNIKTRDYNDMNKKVGALKKAEDAIIIDSSNLTIDEVVTKVKSEIEKRRVNMKISEDIIYIGANDKEIKVFENQYELPNGMAYNSYLIKDEKTVVMDTIDKRKNKEWLEKLENSLDGRTLDYLVISHLEPDHSGSIKELLDKYTNIKLIGNKKTFEMLPQFVDINPNIEKIIVNEGDTINIGKHALQFFMAPMVHWPEVMVTYEQTEKILFSADAFGKFGIIDDEEDWTCEARRYYFGIVGKFGMSVQSLLNKTKSLDIKMICPLHGPVLKENLEYYINKYNTWSSYEPEDEGILIACASIYGHTMQVAKKLEEILNVRGAKKVVLTDLANDDIDEAVEDAFRYSKVVLASSTYNTGIFPPMKHFLDKLQDRNYQKRTVAIIENGSWAPSAGRIMKDTVEKMKDINIIQPVITIKTTMKNTDIDILEKLAEQLLK